MLSVHHLQWDVPSQFFTWSYLGQVPRKPWHRVWGATRKGDPIQRAVFWAGLWMSLGLMCLLWHLMAAVKCLRRHLAATRAVDFSKNLSEYPVFDLRFLKRFLRSTGLIDFGGLDPFSRTEFISNRLMGVQTQHSMASRPTLAIDLTVLHLVDIVAVINWVCPIIVLYLKEMGRRDDGDNLVVRSSQWLNFPWNSWYDVYFLSAV